MICVSAKVTDIEVEVVEVRPTAADESGGPENQNPPYSNLPLIGTSIGRTTRKEIGSLGLYLRAMHTDGSQEIFVLSCAHVFIPNPAENMSESTRLHPFSIPLHPPFLAYSLTFDLKKQVSTRIIRIMPDSTARSKCLPRLTPSLLSMLSNKG